MAEASVPAHVLDEPTQPVPDELAASAEFALVVCGAPLAVNPAELYLARLSPGSRRTMTEALEWIAQISSGGRLRIDTFPWGELRYVHTQAIRSQVVARYAPATSKKILSGLRGTLREAWRLGQMPGEEFHRAIAVEPVRGERAPAGRAITQGELRAIFELCVLDKRPRGLRDAALFALIYQGGLRRSEVVAVDVDDFDGNSGTLRVRCGKGQKERIVYLSGGGRSAVHAWLELRGKAPGPMLVPILKSGRISIRRLTDQSVFDVACYRAMQAGLKDLSPHDFRRAFVGDLLDAGADLSTVQRLAGHANVSTTAKYDRRPEATKKRAAELLHVPFVRR
jgi:site-specific recombinase XerD